MSDRRPDRLERIIERLQRDRRPQITPEDAPDRDAILTAAKLAGARDPYVRMRPEFRRHLADLVGHPAGGGLTRRRLLGSGLTAAAGLAVGLGGAQLLEGLDHSSSHAARVLEPDRGRWIDVAAVTDVGPTDPHPIRAGAVSGYLFRRGGEITGVSDICSHLPCALRWDAFQANILCPCHAKRFSPSGDPLEGSYDVPPLASLRVRVRGERVEVLGI